MVRTDHIQSGMYVRAQTFEAHVVYLQKHFVVLALDDLLERWRTDQMDPDKAYCVITFDDGWRDNYQYAFPVLKQYGLPATIFLATDFIGTDRWFWPDQVMFLLEESKKLILSKQLSQAVETAVMNISGIDERAKQQFYSRMDSGRPIDSDAVVEWCKRLSVEVVGRFVDHLSTVVGVELPKRRVLLNWDEVREMADNGISFGSHSCSHRILTQIPSSEVEQELGSSWQAMFLRGVKPIPVFCYPNGNCNQQVKALVGRHGYLGALGCDKGLEGGKPGDLFNVKRLGLHEDSTASTALFSFAMSGLR
jgi:peptidoglycan/xylan/chitin deacetylase (PgdA/CDA1 family)